MRAVFPETRAVFPETHAVYTGKTVPFKSEMPCRLSGICSLVYIQRPRSKLVKSLNSSL